MRAERRAVRRGAPAPERWQRFLKACLERESADELSHIRVRQENSLRREIERIDAYFENYEHELKARARRSSSANSQLKIAERLAAAKAEHARRRADQEARHEIRVILHLDGLLLVSERAWRNSLRLEQAHVSKSVEVLFVPRSRQWKLANAA